MVLLLFLLAGEPYFSSIETCRSLMKPTILITIAIVILAVSILWYTCNQTYYAQYNDVKRELNKISGVDILEIWGNEDITLEDIYATIKLNNGDTLGFSSLGKWSFDSYKSLSLTGLTIGNFIRQDVCVEGLGEAED
jgi:hypothetical protein